MTEKTLFQIFSIPRESFAKDLLKKSYYTLIKSVHPDKNSLSRDKIEEGAAQFINSAYKTLNNDYTRSVYEYSLDNQQNILKRDLPYGIDKETGVTVLDLEKERIGCAKGLISTEFLDKILSLEDQIDQSYGSALEETEEFIKKEIEKCKENKSQRKSLAQWKYYLRLLDIILKKKMVE